MFDLEFLYAVAQVGATYAGFSTLVTVVAYRNNPGATPARIYYMLLLSIMVVGFAFVPAVVQTYGATEPISLRISSALFGLAWGAYWINALATIKSRFHQMQNLSLLNRLNTYLFHPGAIVVLILGAAGIWGDSTGAVYATALFTMLYMSSYLFLQIITGLLDHKAEP